MVVGYDTRFLSEHFAAGCAAELAQSGFETYVTTRDTPTPTIAYAIRSLKARGGINFTASHNPPQYNGMKFSTADGAPALLAQEHRRVFIGRAAIVNGALNPDPTLAVPPVIGLLAG